jgi:hypothetical protein
LRFGAGGVRRRGADGRFDFRLPMRSNDVALVTLEPVAPAAKGD